MDYNEMIDFITEQFIDNNYGVFIKDQKIFKDFNVILVPNGIDLEMTYRDIGATWCWEYRFEQGHSVSEAMTFKPTVDPVFWRTCLDRLFNNAKRICFDRFKDWTTRSIFKTDDTPCATTIHVRFDVPKPMSDHEFIEWGNSSKRLQGLARFTPLKLGIPHSVSGTAIEEELRLVGQNVIHGTYKPVRWCNDEPSQPIPGKHDWSPSWDRDDRYNSGGYSEYDEWCDYLDEVVGRDE